MKNYNPDFIRQDLREEALSNYAVIKAGFALAGFLTALYFVVNGITGGTLSNPELKARPRYHELPERNSTTDALITSPDLRETGKTEQESGLVHKTETEI